MGWGFIIKHKKMTPDEILKEILDNIPKTDFKEIYAGRLYRRLEKETDPDVKKLFQEKIYSIQITDENKSVLVVEIGRAHV